MNQKLPNSPWNEWARRVILHVPSYLSYDGKLLTAGGRQRKVRDIALIIRDQWEREPVIVQKGTKNFEANDPNGISVIGIKVPRRVWGDPLLGQSTSRLLKHGDAIVYLGHEDAWPFFVKGAKAIHVGVWWDGPFSLPARLFNQRRSLALFEACRSIVTVDTNVINWVRLHGKRGLKLANKCEYIPNYVDLNALPVPSERMRPNQPLRILFARRYEKKRGGELFLDALKILEKEKFPFVATLTTTGQAGVERAQDDILIRGLEDCVRLVANDMDTVMEEYAHADVSVVPTIWSEGTSYSCIESIAAGVPVITTPVGGLANLIIPGVNGLIVPPLPEKIANAIKTISKPSIWYSMHKRCNSMRKPFSKSVWERKILAWLMS